VQLARAVERGEHELEKVAASIETQLRRLLCT
jgi:hypothetical protein